MSEAVWNKDDPRDTVEGMTYIVVYVDGGYGVWKSRVNSKCTRVTMLGAGASGVADLSEKDEWPASWQWAYAPR